MKPKLYKNVMAILACSSLLSVVFSCTLMGVGAATAVEKARPYIQIIMQSPTLRALMTERLAQSEYLGPFIQKVIARDCKEATERTRDTIRQTLYSVPGGGFAVVVCPGDVKEPLIQRALQEYSAKLSPTPVGQPGA